MKLTPGSRFSSAVCDLQVVVVRAPAEEVDLRIGGVPALAAGEEAPADAAADPAFAGEVTMGTRLADADLGIEVLVTKAGVNQVSIGDQILGSKSAKALPASD